MNVFFEVFRLVEEDHHNISVGQAYAPVGRVLGSKIDDSGPI